MKIHIRIIVQCNYRVYIGFRSYSIVNSDAMEALCYLKQIIQHEKLNEILLEDASSIVPNNTVRYLSPFVPYCNITVWYYKVAYNIFATNIAFITHMLYYNILQSITWLQETFSCSTFNASRV